MTPRDESAMVVEHATIGDRSRFDERELWAHGLLLDEPRPEVEAFLRERWPPCWYGPQRRGAK